ncbi:SirB2 family protein [Candidatus Colwellia aromaticivorans]|uniref:SirB2 family protein n=1 Tax=Candidatus Colwellia aromaticivorans TaxID=2267621 RepID=UPI000DF47FC4|nr:SirB2 family protein [Candidatus Colwellia aromaticivorans]
MFKHLHMTLAVLSISLFTLRFIWTLANSSRLQAKWVKITPHIIDTLLLTFGVVMAIQYSINPIEQLWLGEKLLAVVAYIFTGYFTLKLARNKPMQIIGYLGAMGWVMLIVRLAMTREPLFFV